MVSVAQPALYHPVIDLTHDDMARAANVPGLRASPDQYYTLLDQDLQGFSYGNENCYDLTATGPDFVFPVLTGMPKENDCDWGEQNWSVGDMSAGSYMPSLSTGSTISNLSTGSVDTVTAASMRPPARPCPSTRASSLDFSIPPPSFGHFESPVMSEASEASTVKNWCPSPLGQNGKMDAGMATTVGTDSTTGLESPCSWAGCSKPRFSTHEELVWHVKADHLLVCPAPGCVETSFVGARQVNTHLAVAHPELGLGQVKEWALSSRESSLATETKAPESKKGEETTQRRTIKSRLVEQATRERPSQQTRRQLDVPAGATRVEKTVDPMTKELLSVATSKRKCREQLRNAIEKKSKKKATGRHPYDRPKSSITNSMKALDACSSPRSPHPSSAASPTDLVRSRAMSLVESASFPMVYEHTILPFLAEFLPKWTSPKHVISVIRGKTPNSRRICILTETEVSFARKIIISGHVKDLLPENHRHNVSFIFSKGEVVRSMKTWARGLDRNHLDDICPTRNPYYYRSPCMGDSIGIPERGSVNESTATLGPCLNIDEGSYWLSNFHPFLEAYQAMETVLIEHPAPQDREACLEVAHDALSPTADYTIGELAVTSGLNLHTTRVSHEPYWDECGKDFPLVVTDWALTTASSSRANLLRRFPSDMHPTRREPPVKFASAIVPGASVCSSGRTSGYQRGQICEIPAYVSGDANGTRKDTREWFIEEPWNSDEDAWIRGGIGVSGDSGAAIVDSDTNCIIGQVWGRNKQWGPGPRQAFFTPISDVLDDIQEKCGLQARPQLPLFRDEADTYPVLPTCRQCYDLQLYQDSRRSSRVSLQSMILGRGDGDADLTSIEAVSELATPRDYGRGTGLEETGSAFNHVFSPGQLGAITPGPSDARSPYTSMLILDDEQSVPSAQFPARKRSAQLPLFTSSETKRSRIGG